MQDQYARLVYDEELSRTIYRLCRFATAHTENSFAQQATGYLVQIALLDLGRGRHSLQEVCDKIRQDFHLDFTVGELDRIVERLALQKRVQWNKSARTLSLSYRARRSLHKQREQGRLHQQQILDQWLLDVQAHHTGLLQDDLANLEQDLKSFLAHVTVMWSEEFLSAIYPGEVDADGVLEDATTDALSALPAREAALQDVREQAFAEFLVSRDPERQDFLASLLDVAMVVCSLTIDPSSSLLVQERLGAFTHFVDTNLLIFLVGLSNPQMQKRFKRLIELSNEAGAKMVASPRTLVEFQEVLTNTRDYILRDPREARSKAEEQLARKRHSPLTTYIRKCDRTGRAISPQDFFDPYIFNAEALLAEHAITLDATGCDAVIRGTRLDQETRYLVDNLDQYRGRRRQAEHDAFHLLLIQHLRGPLPQSYGVARYWFLTSDTGLPPYALDRRRTPFEAPFCMVLSAWLAFLRTMHPRTEVFAQATSELLFEPAIGVLDEIASDLMQRTRAKYESIADFPRELQEITLISQVLEDMVVAEGQEDKEVEADQGDLWLEEIAMPAAQGILTDDLKFREEVLAKGDRLEKRLGDLESELETETGRTRRLRSIMLSAVAWIFLVIGLIFAHVLGPLPREFLIPGVVWVSVTAVPIAIPWKKLSANAILVVIVLLVAIASGGALLVFPFDKVWKVFAGVSVVAGFVRIVGQLLDRFFPQWGRNQAAG